MMPTRLQLEYFPWYVFAAVWVVSAFWVKRTRLRERSADRLITMIVTIAAYELLFSSWLPLGVLRERFVVEDIRVFWIGFVLACFGVAFAIWARVYIGTNWSARVTLKEDHQLVQGGPYQFVRHPIYAGMLIAALGTALEIGQWSALFAVGLLVAAHSRKALREEALMTKEFGEAYTSYRRGTGFLFPRL